MTPADRAALAKRMNRIDKAKAMARVILETAREYGMPPLEAFPTNDSEWFRVFRMAKCASPPSEETKAICRKLVVDATPPLHILTDEDRELLEELERARRVATDGQVVP